MKSDFNKHICNEKLYSSLFHKYSEDLYKFLYYKYGDHINPKDKVQDAFIKLWENCKNIAPNKAKSFLYTVANNLTLNDLKHQKVVLKHQQIKPKDYTNESPEFILEESEYLKKYQLALGNLTEGERIAFLLNRIEGKKHKEIAQMLEISTKAVEKRIYGALKKLRKDIEGI